VKTNAKKQASGRVERPVFDSIRKPVVPPGHPLARAKPEARAHPAERTAKHKRAPADGGDFD
jgi:DNA-binding transcriptional LysR family regulator